MGRRKRSSSGGSYKESSDNEDNASTSSKAAAQQQHQRVQQVKQWMQTILESRLQGNHNKNTVLHETGNLALLAAYVRRAEQLDYYQTAAATKNNNYATNHPQLLLQEQIMLQADVESQYTALHWALFRGDVATILFLLRHAASVEDVENHRHNHNGGNSHHQAQPRLKQKPMALLEFAPTVSPNTTSSSSSLNLWQKLVCARDAEGATPAQLLAYQQRSDLRACRQGLPQPRITGTATAHSAAVRRQRQPSFDELQQQQQPENQDEELSLEFSNMRLLHQHNNNSDEEGNSSSNEDESSNGEVNRENNNSNPGVDYGCEVLTFGRAHHCALGVGTDGNSSTTTTTAAINNSLSSSDNTNNATFRPQRVQEFAQSRVGRAYSAVAVAAAAHHTLVLNRAGELYSFGLGKGGRLGLGAERHSPQPTLLASLGKGNRRIVAIAAAENHSLAVTQSGQVYAWGSNRFGQLGMDTHGSSTSSNSYHHGGNKKQHTSSAMSQSSSSSSCVLVPRRIDDLREVNVQTVAAGEKHSVAISSQGKLYVWGDNSSGQLGLAPRSSSKSGEKVQQCTTAGLGSKTVISVAASEFATIVLTLPSRDRRTILPVNSIYMMGHGNHVPFKVQLGQSGRGRGNSMSGTDESAASDSKQFHQHSQKHSPIAIASAKFHNVAITRSGLVYTWGLHAETLGTAQHSASPAKKKTGSSSGAMMISSTAQLVERMLPENGGGLAVAVSASENHTAVLTDTGALYTWGSTYGPNILGHQGVRFQPDPRKVPGLYRGVAVAAAKEHFVVLAGTSFPSRPKPSVLPASKVSSLENLAALRVSDFVDLFNVLPVLITAERAQNGLLIQYCMDFCKRNLDGVLNVAQRSVMDCYLREQLQTHSIASDHWLMDDFERREAKDSDCHPLFKSFVLGKQDNAHSRSSNETVAYPTDLTSFDAWIESIEKLMDSLPARLFVEKLRIQKKQAQQPYLNVKQAPRARGVSFGEDRVVTVAKCSPRCLELTREENDTVDNGGDLAALEERQRALMKETRAIRKRLNQISKLEQDESSLTYEQREKIARKSQLQLDLDKLEPTLLKVEKRIKTLSTSESAETISQLAKNPDEALETPKQQPHEYVKLEKTEQKLTFRCGLCGITCSDEASYSLHMNGRKHRNRVVQLEQDERKQKAALLIAEQQKESMKMTYATTQISTPQKPSSPWNQEPKSPAHQPNYKLPPPPHEVPSSLASSAQTKPTSLLDIMATETRKSPGKKQSAKSRQPRASAQGANAAAAASPRKTAPAPRVSQTQTTSKVVGPAPSGWGSLKVDSLPTLESPPWAAASAKPSTTKNVAQARNVNFSLTDFMAPPTGKGTTSQSKAAKKWTTPDRSQGNTTNFATIQDEELAFKGKQDPACSEQGKWFIQQRERAGSLKEIQKNAEQERQDRLFVEEQFRIEQMIIAEAQKKKKEQEATEPDSKRQSNRKKRNSQKKGNSNNKNGSPNKKEPHKKNNNGRKGQACPGPKKPPNTES